MNRLSNVNQHLTANEASSKSKILEKNADDVVIVAAYRSAITRGGKGGFKETTSGELLANLFKATIQKVGIDPKVIGDVVVGNVCNPGAGVNEHRAAQLVAGIPYTTPFQAINRQCSSGLMAVNAIAQEIITGQIDVGLAAGVESMSNNYGPNMMSAFPARFTENEAGMSCLIPMGITSENVTEKYGLTRKEQDEFAAASFQKAEKAQKEGLFKEEILPLPAIKIDENDNESEVTISEDDGIRKGVTAESLGKLRPAFKSDGATTAGNSSQVSDGAGAVILARRSAAEKLGLPIIGKWVHAKVVGVPPEIMGVGPAVAIPAVLKDIGLTVDDVDIFEINEAFASQALYSVRSANIDINKVNPKGGAIAFGHPLGATGARQVSTLMTELKRTGKKIGLTSMCIGTGMGAATVFVSEA
ncbi:3-ketoacyl-CoA thiolase, peroxisomal [Wickerhamiella sorbophila]|uniref:acetyl-CoA C-acyltransferase n=1 Tax=Wickerhamiella sorbophila TaxID=45607 RepID=A0A2T0FI22_9ASCO|nr:3-ketoacyl-CoA thiolase, peroxisomal [Wickerhamiella sorbophila]PRT54644.1 3-ketoacyl-CoA thiolase, peroxisomal [Wickerhamiella sorbophila]